MIKILFSGLALIALFSFAYSYKSHSPLEHTKWKILYIEDSLDVKYVISKDQVLNVEFQYLHKVNGKEYDEERKKWIKSKNQLYCGKIFITGSSDRMSDYFCDIKKGANYCISTNDTMKFSFSMWADKECNLIEVPFRRSFKEIFNADGYYELKEDKLILRRIESDGRNSYTMLCTLKGFPGSVPSYG